jgi:hypothetical protein
MFFMFMPALLNSSRQFVYMRGANKKLRGANKKCRGTLLQPILDCRLAGHQNILMCGVFSYNFIRINIVEINI